MDGSRDTIPNETLQDLCEKAVHETDSDRLRQLARKIVLKLGSPRFLKCDDRSTTASSETPG